MDGPNADPELPVLGLAIAQHSRRILAGTLPLLGHNQGLELTGGASLSRGARQPISRSGFLKLLLWGWFWPLYLAIAP